VVVTFNEDYLAELAGLPTFDMKERVSSKLVECANKLSYTHSMPTVGYDLKGHTGGRAYYQRNHIELNITLMYSHTEEMIESTLPHEFAHIASYNLYGREGTGHGYYWKRTMRELGLSPDRTHCMETVPARQTEKFLYSCDCGKMHQIGKNVHNKIQRGQVRICKTTGTRITYMNYIGPS
jgi:SprT protein